jgi:ATP-dependent exoDNAse (exonuclease V) beta subunit
MEIAFPIQTAFLMPSFNTIEIYKASAGSGKTFSLTLKFLELALQHPQHYRRILAVTFTNKATAEMKHRILEVLHGLATESDEVNNYRQKLLEKLPAFSATDLKQLAHKIYANILHDYSRFSVTTIDSFVQRIIRGFAWELGIDGGFKLQLNTEPVKEALADKLYLRLDDDIHLQRWVVDMARDRLQEGKRWDFRDDMLNLSGELFKETFRKFETAISGYNHDELNQRFSDLNKKVHAAMKGLQNKWKEEGEAMLALLEKHGLQVEDFPHAGSSFANYFNKAARGEITEPGARVKDVIADESKMLSKKPEAALKQKVDAISLTLQRSLQKMVDWYDADIYEFETAKAIKSNLDVLRLMHVFAEELGNYRKENNALLISDTHFLLRQLTEDSSASFIYEKTGQRYQHYLIDEFQDTSAFQWDNFVPLLTEALSYGQYNLIVGDVKQAIYRWRNGDWRLLLYKVQQRLKEFAPQVSTLQENYRSTQQVIAFNNLLFHIAPQLLQAELAASMSSANSQTTAVLEEAGYATIFNDAYADSFQQMPARAKEGGQVHIEWVEENEDSNYDEQVLPLLYERIQGLLADGFSPADMAVLTRTNKEAKLVVEFLVSEQQQSGQAFRVLSGDALMLAGNQAIQIIICAMRWLHNQKHSIALAQLRQLVALQKGLPANSLEVFASNGNNALLPKAFIENKMQLRSLPLSELVHQIIILFELHHTKEHAAYLLAFNDKVQEANKYGETSLQEFLQYWDDEGVDASLPAKADSDALEVVTVHKSKGLAYGIVLMPFLDWELVPKGGPTAPTLWVDNQHTPFNDISVLPIAYKNDIAKSAFASAYYEEFVLAAMDNLNILYVAFTRAKQAVFGWAPFKKTNKESKSFIYKNVGDLMFAVGKSTLALSNDDYQNTREGFDTENKCWSFGTLAKPNEGNTEKKQNSTPSFTYTQWKEKLRLRYQSIAQDADNEIVLPRKQGILLHDILSRMQSPVQLEAVLLQMKREGWLDDYQAQKLQQIISSVLKIEALQPWHQQQHQRLAERSIIANDRKLKRPDLILYNEQECLVYDFKFTAGDDDKEEHRQQVTEYMEMLTQMGFAYVKGWVIYGLENKALPIE